MWKLCCSLKLAILLASLATFLLMGGSLLFPGHPLLFNALDKLPLGQWLTQIAVFSPALSWWFFVFIGITILLLFNTICCFSDWLLNITTRWRKMGEYLIHLGIILLMIGFCLGAISGWRHIALPCTIGELTALPNWPGHYIAVDSFQPVLAENGRPIDMVSQVRLLAGEQELLSGEVRINHPILEAGLVITPASFGRKPVGFSFQLEGSKVDLLNSTRIHLADGKYLEVLRFLPDARIDSSGQMQYRLDQIGNPSFEILLTEAGHKIWQGWYFLSQPAPEPLRFLKFRPLQPLYTNFSSLTINMDPGIKVTATGGILCAVGCFLALLSFYRKRQRLDRPEL